MQGGASSQFSMVPINLLRGKTKANYAHTGHWSKKAIAEAQRYCGVNICTDSSDNKYTNIADFEHWHIAMLWHYRILEAHLALLVTPALATSQDLH
jgi:phosphoserine aminotransferase